MAKFSVANEDLIIWADGKGYNLDYFKEYLSFGYKIDHYEHRLENYAMLRPEIDINSNDFINWISSFKYGGDPALINEYVSFIIYCKARNIEPYYSYNTYYDEALLNPGLLVLRSDGNQFFKIFPNNNTNNFTFFVGGRWTKNDEKYSINFKILDNSSLFPVFAKLYESSAKNEYVEKFFQTNDIQLKIAEISPGFNMEITDNNMKLNNINLAERIYSLNSNSLYLDIFYEEIEKISKPITEDILTKTLKL